MRWQSSRNTSHESALQVPQHLPLSLQIRLICMPLEDRIYLRRCARISTRWTSNCVAINLVLIDLIALAVMVAHQAYVILPLKAYVILPLKLHKPIASSQGKCYLRYRPKKIKSIVFMELCPYLIYSDLDKNGRLPGQVCGC